MQCCFALHGLGCAVPFWALLFGLCSAVLVCAVWAVGAVFRYTVLAVPCRFGLCFFSSAVLFWAVQFALCQAF